MNLYFLTKTRYNCHIVCINFTVYEVYGHANIACEYSRLPPPTTEGCCAIEANVVGGNNNNNNNNNLMVFPYMDGNCNDGQFTVFWKWTAKKCKLMLYVHSVLLLNSSCFYLATFSLPSSSWFACN